MLLDTVHCTHTPTDSSVSISYMLSLDRGENVEILVPHQNQNAREDTIDSVKLQECSCGVNDTIYLLLLRYPLRLY